MTQTGVLECVDDAYSCAGLWTFGRKYPAVRHGIRGGLWEVTDNKGRVRYVAADTLVFPMGTTVEGSEQRPLVARFKALA